MDSITCSYCQTESVNTAICDFCKADLNTKRPQIDDMLSQEDAFLSQPELAQKHTYDLMRLLRQIRAERSDMYKTMQTVRKAPHEAINDEYEDINQYGQDLYRHHTAQKNVIEQLLIDRMGYYPYRIDKKLLKAMRAKINR